MRRFAFRVVPAFALILIGGVLLLTSLTTNAAKPVVSKLVDAPADQMVVVHLNPVVRTPEPRPRPVRRTVELERSSTCKPK